MTYIDDYIPAIKLGGFNTRKTVNIDLSNTTNTPQIKLASDTTNSSPSIGDLWRESSALKYYDGTSSVTLGSSISGQYFLIYKSGSTYYAMNGNTGSISYSGTNASTVCQSAIDEVSAAGGGTVFIKNGTYTLSSTITLKSKVRIAGEGMGTIIAPAGANYSAFTNLASVGSPTTDITVENLKIDGTNVVDGAYTTNSKGIFLKYSLRLKLLNLWVYNCSASGLGVDYLKETLIHGCVCESNGRGWSAGQGGGSGIGIGTNGYSNEDCLISDCHCVSNGNYGIFYETQTANVSQSINMTAINNSCHDNGTAGICNSGAAGVIFYSNLCYANGSDGILINKSIQDNTYPEQTIVSGNMIFSNTGCGINVADESLSIRELMISNNFLNTNGSEGVKIASGSRVTISGNQIIASVKSGILVNPASTAANNFLVQGNIVNNNGTGATAGNKDGIRFSSSGSGTFTDVVIQNNRCFDNQGTPKQDYGIVISGTHTRTIISGNNLNGNKTNPINVSTASATCVIRNNTTYNPVGLSAITVGSSPYTYTAGNSPETIYITGGTVSDVSKSSTTIFSASGCSVDLEPNEALVVTYSGLPTMNKDIH